MSEYIDYRGYKGNQNIKGKGVQISWTKETILEYERCAKDPIYFAENYIKIVHVDRGLIPIELYDYQKEIIDKITHHRRVSVVTARQSGKCQKGDTVVSVRNRKTGEIYETTLEEIYEKLKNNKLRE